MNEKNSDEINYDFKVDSNLNHTTSHLLAAAIVQLYPNVKLGFGPAIEEGFYYDFEFENPLSKLELLKIEKLMKKLASMNLKMVKVDGSNYDFTNKPYKKELYDELKQKGQEITFYSLVDTNGKEIFTDLCAGGHVESTSKINNFKLLSLAGAYWRGNSNNIQLTRIYGSSFYKKDELENYLKVIEDRKERDHRKIGKNLGIFTFSSLSGLGFPIWLKKGMLIKRAIEKEILYLDRKYGFEEVLSPHFGEESLYIKSGHLAHYQETMFKSLEVENEKLIPRPMTCPHHIIIYDAFPRSYRELPLRLSEQSRLYRYEKSGALTGLERVRTMDLTEGHIFIRQDQIKDEVLNMINLIQETLKIFKIKIDHVALSLRDNDKEKFFDDDQMWDQAESALKEILDQNKIDYIVEKGEAAFYGPKIDFQVKTVLNNIITMSTIQLDFLLPRKFNISYIAPDGSKQTPLMIHRGLIGTYERFVSILLEQTKGNFPFWLSPSQVIVLPIAKEFKEYAFEIYSKIFKQNFNVEIDNRDETINKKIREAQINKYKYQIIIGKQEMENKTIAIREYGKVQTITMDLESFIEKIKSQRDSKE
ncbi:THREONYL-TRNA SYNTHETASE 1 (THREONINE--TRNA LIGASE) (THRRS) [Mycoplasmopsis pulmonis]|uniref:Threonine--tRNA ligase n=1 Tax=Mycoplasmopsis pulmonis (strain UAB CTIP) TaxID=272635 RepID=SYT_MYCPU|nr:threonine--tRNA ligase [Mycoplasmopsis pulmonis]Q98PH6.1 RecName: Full=Threonine--tRNA ligase; AltName: Full=Threonyl-tRNA synthetase; Short=ThrRS [Mycoplasmopsis pulmonis UAB CTIP]CAC13919.1 THREONYL-TRNA SYNTHETASE 1 (THREONINE--TRNA LIGASE) (THRRS) [Mycoplasmopsis pulmonis]